MTKLSAGFATALWKHFNSLYINWHVARKFLKFNESFSEYDSTY